VSTTKDSELQKYYLSAFLGLNPENDVLAEPLKHAIPKKYTVITSIQINTMQHILHWKEKGLT
jgi:hypothetical protein